MPLGILLVYHYKWLKGIGGGFSLQIEGTEVNIKISSTVMNVQTFEDAGFVPRGSCGGIWNIVLD